MPVPENNSRRYGAGKAVFCPPSNVVAFPVVGIPASVAETDPLLAMQVELCKAARELAHLETLVGELHDLALMSQKIFQLAGLLQLPSLSTADAGPHTS